MRSPSASPHPCAPATSHNPPDSDAIRPPFRFESGHLGRLRPQRLLPADQQLRHTPPVRANAKHSRDRRGDGDAGEAGTEHATIATSIAASPRPRQRAGDRAVTGRGALDGPGQSVTGGGGGIGVAVGGGRHRRNPGTAAVWPLWGYDRPTAPDRTGLGGLGARVETARRDDDDPLGGIPRGSTKKAMATVGSATFFAASSGD